MFCCRKNKTLIIVRKASFVHKKQMPRKSDIEMLCKKTQIIIKNDCIETSYWPRFCLNSRISISSKIANKHQLTASIYSCNLASASSPNNISQASFKPGGIWAPADSRVRPAILRAHAERERTEQFGSRIYWIIRFGKIIEFSRKKYEWFFKIGFIAWYFEYGH